MEEREREKLRTESDVSSVLDQCCALMFYDFHSTCARWGQGMHESSMGNNDPFRMTHPFLGLGQVRHMILLCAMTSMLPCAAARASMISSMHNTDPSRMTHPYLGLGQVRQTIQLAGATTSMLKGLYHEQRWPSTFDKVSMVDINTLKVSMSTIGHRPQTL